MPSQPRTATKPQAPDTGVFRETWVWLLALAGLGGSIASAYVHYRLLNDPTYTSFCDATSTFSCSSAYQSQFGSFRGVPVAILGVVWFAVALGLLWLRRMGPAQLGANVPGYLFAWSTIGLSVVLYLGYAAFFVLKTVCLLCVVSYVAVTGIFLLSGSAPGFPMTSLPRRFFADVRALAASPLALVATLVFGAAVLSTVVLFPRVEAASTSEPATAGTETEVQGPAVTASQQTELERWYESQPRENVPVEGGGATVVIVKFNDYQCPPCKMTYEQYRPIRTKYAASAPGKVQFVTKDFPLESECNATIPNGGPHPTACEAAVAVRLAREKNKAEAIEEWLFANQENVTLPGLKGALTQLAGVTDFDARYRATLEQVKADSALGGLLNVKSTPTFFINGVRVVGGLAPQFLDAIIAYELRKTAK